MKKSPVLGPPVVPFYPFLGKGPPTKIDYRKKGAPILSTGVTGGPSLLADWRIPHEKQVSPLKGPD